MSNNIMDPITIPVCVKAPSWTRSKNPIKYIQMGGHHGGTAFYLHQSDPGRGTPISSQEVLGLASLLFMVWVPSGSNDTYLVVPLDGIADLTLVEGKVATRMHFWDGTTHEFFGDIDYLKRVTHLNRVPPPRWRPESSEYLSLRYNQGPGGHARSADVLIERLLLGSSAERVFREAGILTAYDALSHNRDELMSMPGIGPISVADLVQAMRFGQFTLPGDGWPNHHVHGIISAHAFLAQIAADASEGHDPD